MQWVPNLQVFVTLSCTDLVDLPRALLAARSGYLSHPPNLSATNCQQFLKLLMMFWFLFALVRDTLAAGLSCCSIF